MTLAATLEEVSDQLQSELESIQSSRFSHERTDRFLEFVFLDRNNFHVPFLKVRIVDHDLFRTVSHPEGKSGVENNMHELRLTLLNLAEEICEDETQFDHLPSAKGLGNRHEVKE